MAVRQRQGISDHAVDMVLIAVAPADCSAVRKALPAERKALEATRDQTIRLIFYGPVSSRFQEAYGPKLDAGYKALGMDVPNFKTMSRAQALASIGEFQTKLAAAPGAGDAATKLGPVLRDFGELKPSVIPDTWI